MFFVACVGFSGAGCQQISNAELLALEVEILIPAALENQVTGENVDKVARTVRIVAEGANGPTTPEADEVLKQRGIFVIPDLLANAGGVTCSYFEQVQSNMNYYWSKDEVLGKLDVKMTSAFHDVYEMASRRDYFFSAPSEAELAEARRGYAVHERDGRYLMCGPLESFAEDVDAAVDRELDVFLGTPGRRQDRTRRPPVPDHGQPGRSLPRRCPHRYPGRESFLPTTGH